MIDPRIETFLCVCRNMNYTRAAEELGLTQPAVTHHIKYLEEYYQTRLFEYRCKKLHLTPQGEFLKQTMENIVHDENRIRDDIKRVGCLEVIHIGATMSIAQGYLPSRLASFIDTHPELNVQVTVDDTKNLLALLDAGKIDFMLCEGYFEKQNYHHMLVRKERLAAFAAKDYKLPERVEDISDLFRERIILREEGSGTRAIFENMLHEKGYSITAFKKRCSVNNPVLISRLVLAGTGISFLYESVGESYIRDGRMREITIPDFHMEHEFNALWKKGSIFEEKYQVYIRELTEA